MKLKIKSARKLTKELISYY